MPQKEPRGSNVSTEKHLKYFFWYFNLMTEGISFFIIIPILVFYVWFNIQLTPHQMFYFNRIWPIATAAGLIIVLTNNWVVLRPVMKYFRSIITEEALPGDEYEKSRKRFLMLPVIHSAGAFFRWIICLASAIVPLTIISSLTTAQIINMWLGVLICAVFGFITYFSITEIYIQHLLNRGIFPEAGGYGYSLKLNILKRIYMMTISAIFISVSVIVTFFYTTIENYDIADLFMYIKIGIWVAVSICLGIFISILLNRTLLDKISLVMEALKKISGGELDGREKETAVKDELSEINDAVFDMKEKLKSARDELLQLNADLESKVEKRTEELQAAMEELEAANTNLLSVNKNLEESGMIYKTDLEMAGNVQCTFLPKEAPVSDEYQVSYIYSPLSGVSGDFYDFYYSGNDLSGIGIFDVSGHGISSGLITLLAKSIISKDFEKFRDEDLSTMLEMTNKDLIDEIGHLDNYITGIVLRFNGNKIEYVNSGHPEMLYRIADTRNAGKILDKRGKSIRGKFLGIPILNEEYRTLNLSLQKGDCLLLYTDGITESKNPEGQSYEESRLMNAFKNAPYGSAGEILKFIINDFNNFIREESNLSDDMTIIVIKRK